MKLAPSLQVSLIVVSFGFGGHNSEEARKPRSRRGKTVEPHTAPVFRVSRKKTVLTVFANIS